MYSDCITSDRWLLPHRLFGLTDRSLAMQSSLKSSVAQDDRIIGCYPDGGRDVGSSPTRGVIRIIEILNYIILGSSGFRKHSEGCYPDGGRDVGSNPTRGVIRIIEILNYIILGSSGAEQAAVNRWVVGSNPTRGA